MSKLARGRKAKIITPRGAKTSRNPKASPDSHGATVKPKIVGRNPQASSTDEWYTPEWLIQALGGDFELDPSAPQSTWYTAKQCYTQADDGLSKDWGTKYVFLNPPYGDIEPWMDKVSMHQNGIALTFTRTDTNWMQECGLSAELVLFIDKRLKFVRGERQPDGSVNLTNAKAAPSPSVLLAFGDRAVSALARAFLSDKRLYGRLLKGLEPSEAYADILHAPNDPAIFQRWPEFR